MESLSLQLRSGQALSKVEWIINEKVSRLLYFVFYSLIIIRTILQKVEKIPKKISVRSIS